MDGVSVIKNVSIKQVSCFNGGNIGDHEGVCQTLQLIQWREYWWSRTCLSNSSDSSMEDVIVIKDVSPKHFSFFNGGSIGDQERVCQTIQFLQWREDWWSRKWRSNWSAWGSIGDQERVCQILQLLQWKEYWWSRTCLSNTSDSLMDGIFVIKTCQSNSSDSSMEGVLVIKSLSAKLFSFFNGGSIGDHEGVCQPLQLIQWREDWW